jgi:(S)-3,5-dihydroxyphenylglycine transaminase
VIYLGSFSKILFPGLRLGFIVADQQTKSSAGSELYLAQELSTVKSLTTVNTSPILQGILGGILLSNGYSLRPVIDKKIQFYKANRDAMIESLERHFGEDPLLGSMVSWGRPGGGFFLPMSLPFDFTTDMVKQCAEAFGVLVCPMSFFSSSNEHKSELRLSFSYLSQEQIAEGVQRLWRFVRHVADRAL